MYVKYTPSKIIDETTGKPFMNAEIIGDGGRYRNRLIALGLLKPRGRRPLEHHVDTLPALELDDAARAVHARDSRHLWDDIPIGGRMRAFLQSIGELPPERRRAA